MRIANDDILSSPADLSSSFESNAIYLGHAKFAAIQLVFTGTPQGSFKLQASNDKGGVQKSTEAGRGDRVQNWTDVSGSMQNITESGNHMWAFELTPFRWVRVVWTPTGGSGTLIKLQVNTKGV